MLRVKISKDVLVFSNDSQVLVSGQFSDLLLRRRALRITCFFLGGSSGRGRFHLLDLLVGGGAAAEQVPGRVGRADEAAAAVGDDHLVLLPFLAVVPVRPRLGGNLRQSVGTRNGLVGPDHHRLPLQVGADGGGRRVGAREAPLQARAYRGHRRRRAREVLEVPEEQRSHGVGAVTASSNNKLSCSALPLVSGYAKLSYWNGTSVVWWNGVKETLI